jgi:hypothetical protein
VTIASKFCPARTLLARAALANTRASLVRVEECIEDHDLDTALGYCEAVRLWLDKVEVTLKGGK